MFSLRWLRRIVRKNMKPVHELDAIKWKQRLAIAYAFCAWNALGVVAYKMYNNQNDWASFYGLKLEEEQEKRPGIYYAEAMGVKKATIIKFNNFTPVETVEYIAPEK